MYTIYYSRKVFTLLNDHPSYKEAKTFYNLRLLGNFYTSSIVLLLIHLRAFIFFFLKYVLMEIMYTILCCLHAEAKPAYKVPLLEGDELYKLSLAFIQILYLLACNLLLHRVY